MSLLEIVGLILATVVAGFAVLMLIGALRLSRMRQAYRRRIAAAGVAELTAQANLFGQASAGKSQTPGPGTLVLTESELAFVQLVPARELRVSRESITSARLTRHFLGKTPGRDLLAVMWETNGMGDATAFDLADTAEWITRLK